MALPVTLKVTGQNGYVQLIKLPVEVWQRGAKWTLRCNSTTKIASVIIDPDRRFPDTDRSNNVYKMP